MRNQIFNLTMPEKVRRTTLVAALFLATINITLAQGLTPAITVQPDTIIEVGEEIFFSATGTAYPTNPAQLRQARYEWDFGDGYSFKYGSPNPNSSYSGLAVVHYFMMPGTFNVKLIVSIYTEFDGEGVPTSPPVDKDSIITVIHVTGTAPIAGFEIQHAPFHNRLAQYLYVIIPASYRGNQTTLRVSLSGSGNSNTILLTKNNLASEEKILLDQKSLVQSDYVVIAELLDAGNQLIPGGIWHDKFSKRYPGLPKVGIDENNSIYVNGQLFFPIMPYMTNNDRVQEFIDSAGINGLHTEGWYTSHNVGTWTDYLNKAADKGLLCVGPTRGDYNQGELAPRRQQFNHDVNRMTEYILNNNNNPAMMMWSWEDEPNMGGRNTKVDLPVLAAWQYITHSNDINHLLYNGFYMYDWSKYYVTGLRSFDYLQSHVLFGGKKWISDVIGGDIYPINYRLSPHLNFADMGPYAAYLDALDRFQTNNKHLVPCIPALQPCEETAGDNTPAVTADQVYLEAWMNVIHGAKGILWFPYFVRSTMQWKSMKKFADQMKVLAPVVLGPETPRMVTDDANTPLNRVDAMIRENDTCIYLFAARVTEPDLISGAAYQGIEPGSITVNFIVSGLSGPAAAEVMDESRTISVTNGQFTDTFDKNAVHIYRIDTPASISDEKLSQIPSHVILEQNYPNPFNPSTAISFGLPSQSFVSLKVFDVVGSEVATIVSEELPAGYYSRQWNAANMASGVYFYRLQAGSITKTKKLILLR